MFWTEYKISYLVLLKQNIGWKYEFFSIPKLIENLKNEWKWL